MPLDLDMVVETGPPDPPFSEDVRLGRQRPQGWLLDCLEQLPPGLPDMTKNAPLVQVGEHLADGGIQLG